ncbi:MAG: hypothetical protein K0S70_126 [Microbacterium sp.]|jgi:hypothetical protein|nr:hypothetical protein [Microbacterium sp.]
MANPVPNQGAVPIDTTSLVGQVRLLTGDTDAKNVTGPVGEYVWMSDSEISGYLSLHGDSPQRAAIFILRMVAMTPAMQYKKWSSADLSVDGPAITTALRALIADIEKSLDADAAGEVADFIGIAPTGAAVSQPALLTDHPLQWRGVDTDPTLPLRML